MRAPLLWLFAAAVCLRAVVFLVVSHRGWSTRSRQDGAGRGAPSTGRAARPPGAMGAVGRLDPLAALQRLERYHTATPNTSRVVVVLGHKAQRDFPVYSFAFEWLGYRVLFSRAPLLIGPEPSSELYYLAESSGSKPTRLEGVAALLCHSVLAYNCFRGFSPAPARPTEPPTPPRASDPLRVFASLRRGQRINRLAAARQALTTKDGLCATLQQSGLSREEISSFSFPCWSLPREAAQLRVAAVAAAGDAAGSEGGRGGEGVSDAAGEPVLTTHGDPVVLTAYGAHLRTTYGDHLRRTYGDAVRAAYGAPVPADASLGTVGASSSAVKTSSSAVKTSSSAVKTWIVKPARGSEGAGIQLLNTSQLLFLLDECYLEPSTGSGGGDAGWHGSAEEARATGGGCGRSAAVPRVFGGTAVASPYLSSPLLRAGRKWDVRAYVLCTSLLPMRLYLFGEAIVRYASARYSATSSDRAAALTNTAVGKRELKRGVGPITGTVEDLARYLGGRREGEGGSSGGGGGGDFGGESGAAGGEDWADDSEGERRDAWRGVEEEGEEAQAPAAADGRWHAETAYDGYAGLINAMRRTLSRLFLTAEPQLTRLYASDARNPAPPEGTATAGTRGAQFLSRHRCSNCYHLFGVDLIADTAGGFLAIEINIQPDLSLSRSGCAAEQPNAAAAHTRQGERSGGAASLARMAAYAAYYGLDAYGLDPTARSGKGDPEATAAPASNASTDRCAHGSPSYDDTKRAVAFSAVQMVYSRRSAAAKLHSLLAPHARTLSTRFPRLAWNREQAGSPGDGRTGGAAASGGTAAAAAWDAAAPTGNNAASTDYFGADGPGAPFSGGDSSGEEQLTVYGLQHEVLDYLLGAVREGLESGCFVPVIPSAHGWADQARHLRSLWRAAAARHGCDPPPSEGDAMGGASGNAYGGDQVVGGGYPDGICAGFDFERRRQMHALTGLVLGGLAADTGNVPPRWRPSFRERCEQALARVPVSSPLGRWALREHIFQTVHELDN